MSDIENLGTKVSEGALVSKESCPDNVPLVRVVNERQDTVIVGLLNPTEITTSKII